MALPAVCQHVLVGTAKAKATILIFIQSKNLAINTNFRISPMIRQITLVTIFLCNFLLALSQNSKDKYWKKLPQPIGWINDFEDLFTPQEEKSLDSLIADFEKRTTIEIAIVTIPTSATEKERFDELTLHLANTWGLGKKEKNNGILIGISKGYRRIRIQNGYGIEKLISDSQTKQLIDQVLIPGFKADRYFNAVFDGIQEMKQLLDQGATSGFIYFNEVSIYQFLERLKIDNQNPNHLNILTIALHAPENWLTEKDIDSLMTLIHSTEPAKCVVQAISSYLPIGDSSTIGGQVMDIIEAFKDKKSYPTVQWSCAKTDQVRINLLTAWWKEQKK